MLKSFSSCIHQQHAVSITRCLLWASVSVEQTCLNQGASRSSDRKVTGVDQKTLEATICVENHHLREENAGEGMQSALILADGVGGHKSYTLLGEAKAGQPSSVRPGDREMAVRDLLRAPG